MAASMKQSYGDEELLYSSSKSVTKMKYPSNERPLPDSPNALPATQMQDGRKKRRRNYVGDFRERKREREIKKLTKPPVLENT